MKKKILLAFTALIFLMSCKKDNYNFTLSNECKVVKFTSIGYSGYNDYGEKEYVLDYFSNGKISKITTSDEIRRFSYEANKMLVSIDQLLLTYNYNDVKQINTITTNRQLPEYVSVTYKDNKVSKITTSIYDITSIFTYSNNEIVKINQKWGDLDHGEVLITYNNEKYSDPLIFELIFPSIIDGHIRHFIRYILVDSFGSTEKKLINKIEYIGVNHEIYRTETFSYLKDDKGNITQIIIDDKFGPNNIPESESDSRSFVLEYNCK